MMLYLRVAVDLHEADPAHPDVERKNRWPRILTSAIAKTLEGEGQAAVAETEPGTLTGLVNWYEFIYTPQLEKGSGTDPLTMAQNLAVIRDAVESYRQHLEDPARFDIPAEEKPAELAPPIIQPTAELQRLMRQRGGDLERGDQINIDARGAQIGMRPEATKRYFKCGNCGERVERTDDPIQNHHLAMQHKTACRTFTVPGEAKYAREEYDRLVMEHAAQPMQVAAAYAEEKKIPLIEALQHVETARLHGLSSGLTLPEALYELDENPRLLQAPAPATQPARPPRRWWQFWRWFEK